MNKYYEVVATIDGDTEVLYGSFLRADCKDEIDAEKDTWKADGYKSIKIVTRECSDQIDKEVYTDNVITKDELFLQYAPSFNFELDAEQLVSEGLERGFITHIEGDSYLINKDY